MNDKIVRVTFTKESGRKPYDQDLRELTKGDQVTLMSAPANHGHYVQLCAMIASNGLVIKAERNKVEYIAPSQIEKVEIIFETGILNKIIGQA